MKKHKLYMTDEFGHFNGYDRKKVWIDEQASVLRIGKTKVPLAEITACEPRLLARGGGHFLAIDVCGPTINDYEPTTLMLIHKNFFGSTKLARMRELADELQPFIEGNVGLERPDNGEAHPEGTLRAQYALNISLVLAYYRSLWYSYDKRKTIITKTIFLMLLGGTINVFGPLLVAVPFDNYRMSRNLAQVGWSKPAALVAYLLATVPAFAFWTSVIIWWLVGKE